MLREEAHLQRVAPFSDPFDHLTATYLTHTFARHTHEGYAIGVVERGAQTFYYRGAMHTAPAGSMVVVHPGELHTGQALNVEGWSYRMIYPAVSLIQRAAQELEAPVGHIPWFPNTVFHDAELSRSFLYMHRALGEAASTLERETLLLHTLTALIQRHAEFRPSAPVLGKTSTLLEQARDYLTAHYAEDVSLERLAALVNLSPYHLSHRFRQQFGLPPHAYLMQVRVEQARRRLAAGLPPAETALATGFADQPHLTRAFKRIVGVGPGQYQRAVDTTVRQLADLPPQTA